MSNSFTVNTYSPKDVSLMIGSYTISGWDSISVQRSQKTFIPAKGIRGKHTRVGTKDTSATLSIVLMASSPTNDVFSQIVSNDVDLSTGRLAVTLKDMSGKSVFMSIEGYFTGYPVKTFTNVIGQVTWEIFCQTTVSYVVGGNTRPSTSLFDKALNEATSFVKGLI